MGPAGGKTEWLAGSGLTISPALRGAQDLTTDFGDGIRLIKLVETISEETLGKYHKNPVRSWLRAAAPVPEREACGEWERARVRALELAHCF